MISTVCGPRDHKIVIIVLIAWGTNECVLNRIVLKCSTISCWHDMFATGIYLLLYLAGCHLCFHHHQKHKLHVQEIKMQLSRYWPHSLLHWFVLVIKFDFMVCKIVNESGWAMSSLFFGKCFKWSCFGTLVISTTKSFWFYI